MKRFTIYTLCYFVLIALPFVAGGQFTGVPVDLDIETLPKHFIKTAKQTGISDLAISRDADELLILRTRESFKSNGWNGTDSTEYFYNSEQLLVEERNKYFDYFASSWDLSSRINYEYDSNNNLTYRRWQSWNGTAWENSTQVFRTYDANNNMTLELIQEWYNNVWRNFFRYTYEFDSNNNRTSFLEEKWHDIDWENEERHIHEYDANGNQSLLLIQKWNGSAWENDDLNLTSFDSNDNLTSWIIQRWNAMELHWVHDTKNNFEYDINDNQTLRLIKRWDGLVWENYLQYLWEYDFNDNETLLKGQVWSDSTWANWFRDVFEYDMDGNLTSKLRQEWAGTEWENDYQDIYDSNSNGNRTYWLHQNWNNATWENDYRYYYYYQLPTNVGEIENPETDLVVFPNPTQHLLNIDFQNENWRDATIKVYDATGKVFYYRNYSGAMDYLVLDVLFLSTGAYYLQITDDQKYVVKSIQIVR